MPKARILVVDDEKVARELLLEALSSEGFFVRAVANGFEALDALKADKFDLMLTDLNMPQMTGNELIAKIRDTFPDLLIIVMTAYASLETAIKTMQQGAYDYVLKPFTSETIIPVVKRGLERLKLKQKTLELAEVAQKLKELEQIKSDLLDTITHEFSTPISILKAYVDMFLTGHFDSSKPRCREGLRSMHSAIIRLERLVMNLLTLSMGKNKKLNLVQEQVLVQDLISNAISQLKEEIQKKEIRLVLNIPPNLPAIWADPSKLSIALVNLLDNSIKFNKTGGFIRVTLTKPAPQIIGIVISDTGSGIPEAKIEEIFNPFTQVDMSSTREYQGTGLGLPAAKAVIESHGGRITAKSKIGKGSSFMIVIPCGKPTGRSISTKKS